jgi:2-oxo-4-hydroxy-4-carboxy-5-ureidoimidazoline decarboxylase
VNAALAAWNEANEAAALKAMLACCGARRWAGAMLALRPMGSVEELTEAANRTWARMEEADWLEAFACHPRIGARNQIGRVDEASKQSADWSRQEQSSTASASAHVLEELAQGNSIYKRRFGFTYIICATGKTAEEMLAILKRRLANSREAELREAAEQQRQIMQIRLGKWMRE